MQLMAVDKSKYLSRFAHRVFFLHVKSTAASGQKREARWRTRARLGYVALSSNITFNATLNGMATTGCRMMSFSLQKSKISCEVNSFALSMRK